MRLFVVCGSYPYFCATTLPSRTYTAPQPPGPGFGWQDPSVNTPEVGPAVNRANTSATGRFMVAVTVLRPLAAPFAIAPPFPDAESRQSMHAVGFQVGYFTRTASGNENALPHLAQRKVSGGIARVCHASVVPAHHTRCLSGVSFFLAKE